MESLEEKYIEKLMQMPEAFKKACYQKQWARAKYIYDSALRVTEFLDPPENVRNQLFGDKQDDRNVIEGLFNEELVSKAYEECAVKSYKAYELESYRRFGQPPQYYPAPRYPVPGYEKNE